ncbi:MAG: release factor glutamine methyltransferase [Alphaproteobacteria bacterium]|jgi:release factor glutamine methyltransferase|nr:release factor glutamine methyltransferase [Alphaproteobacteria bacterium]
MALAQTTSFGSVADARRSMARQFRGAGIETPELDARVLIGHALGLDHAALAAGPDRMLSRAEVDAIGALAARRQAHEPVARILGRKEFWGLSFALNADTLVPRPETETVVEAALAALDRNRREHPMRVADLGTGTGAILLALLSELPAAAGVGTDISTAALVCARANAAALGLAGRASFVACDYGAALAGPFDLVVSNPPYVRRGDLAALPPEVRVFDPLRALDGGADGLDGYRAIAADARRLLAPDGTLVAELGAGQLDAVASTFAAAGLAVAAVKHDLLGVARALVVKPLP